MQAEILLYHHSAKFLESFRWHVKGVIDEYHILHPRPGHRPQFMAHSLATGSAQGSGPRRIVAEAALERATPCSTGLGRHADQFWVESCPVDRRFIKVIIFRHAAVRDPLVVDTEDEIIHFGQRPACPDGPAEIDEGPLSL